MVNNTVYFDNAATTFPKPECVYKDMDYFYRNYGANVGRGQYKMSSIAANITDETRQLIKKLFYCTNKEVVFSPSSTVSLNLVIRNAVKAGMNVYISPFEHNAVTRTLTRIQKQININIIQLPLNKNSLEYDFNKISNRFNNKKPGVIILSHVSNVCGLIAPFEDIFKIAKEHDAITVLDMSQSAGLINTNLSNLNIDYAIIAGHKTLYGPFGISAIISNEKMLYKLEPIITGGTGVDSANQNMPNILPQKLEAGSHNILAIAGLNSALKWILDIGVTALYEKDKENQAKLLNIIKKYDNITIIGHKENSVGVVSCVFDGFSPDEIGNILSQNGIAVRTGLDCSPFAHECLGTFPAGAVRFSTGYFNTDEDFEKLDEILQLIQDNT